MHIISIIFLGFGLLAFIRASRLRDRAKNDLEKAERYYKNTCYIATFAPEGYHWVDICEGNINVVADHGVDSSTVKVIRYDANDPEDRSFAVREAEELIEILKRKTI